MRKYKTVSLIVLLGLLLRLIAFPFAQIVDADATTRVLIAESWLQSPSLIYEGVWPPLHFYFNALAIAVSGERLVMPILFHIIIGSLTAYPIYFFTKREFNARGAWLSALLYVLCPVVFRNSFHTLSGVPYAFFVALALNYLSKSVREEKPMSAMLAGLAMTIASGFRYEAWLLIALFTGMLLLLKHWKLTVYFWTVSMVFPLFWMIGNYAAHQDILYGLTGAYQWNIVAEGVNDYVLFFDRLKRLFYFPVSWFFFFSPFLSIWLIIILLKKIKRRELIKNRVIWAVPFWVVFAVFVYKAYEGTLLLQHRFSTSLIVLSVPFASIIADELKWTKWRKISMIAILSSILPLSYLWMYLPFDYSFFFFKNLQKAVRDNRINSISSFRAIPRLVDQEYGEIAKKIRSRLRSEDALILDFISWENTYFVAFEAAPGPGQVFFVDGATHGNIDKRALYETLSKHPRGAIMLRCDSKFEDIYDMKGDAMVLALEEDVFLKLIPLHNKLGVGTFLYEKIDSPVKSGSLPCFTCPEKGTVEHYMLEVINNAGQFNIDEKAFYKGISREEMIRLDAEWLYHENLKKK